MKKKDLIQLVVALAIFLVAVVLIYLQVAPQNAPGKAAKTATVDVITPIASDYDHTGLSNLGNQAVNRDFYVPPDLHSGIGNPQPFGAH